jgi:hypothetical protein
MFGDLPISGCRSLRPAVVVRHQRAPGEMTIRSAVLAPSLDAEAAEWRAAGRIVVCALKRQLVTELRAVLAIRLRQGR